MGKIKSFYWDEINSGTSDYDEACYEYQMMMYQEEQQKLLDEEAKNYVMTDEEAHFYTLYMEDKLCGELENTAPVQRGINSKNGQSKGGLKLRRPRSKR